MSDPPFYKLPVELIDLIIEYLTSKDCKSLRQICWRFNTLVTPHAFRNITLSVANFDHREKQNLEGTPELIYKYGHLVRSLTVDVYGSVMADHWRWKYEEHPFIKRLRSRGEDYEHELMVDDCCLFRHASLLTPVGLRILPNLRFLNLSLVSLNTQRDGHPFLIIPSVENITLKALRLEMSNFAHLPRYQGTTNLKSFTINCPFIKLDTLKSMLSFPRALTHLELQCCSQLHQSDRAWSATWLRSTLEVQRASLEILVLRETRDVLEMRFKGNSLMSHRVEPSRPGYVFDLSGFPRLREYRGFYPETSGKFKQGGEGTGS
ncbi:hypothetical protein N8T08_004064 [Aspergillus melleus]|uniref:Uncharacterized protein n=1 Tax=Aspergillus melleus TaxID=138277 RepID=A0ACC3B5H5_9EURO|nr:hypothetical protein N8T08_004064 [Aspergillus melleus]